MVYKQYGIKVVTFVLSLIMVVGIPCFIMTGCGDKSGSSEELSLSEEDVFEPDAADPATETLNDETEGASNGLNSGQPSNKAINESKSSSKKESTKPSKTPVNTGPQKNSPKKESTKPSKTPANKEPQESDTDKKGVELPVVPID